MKGPITRVAIFDFEQGVVGRLKTVEKGFVGSFQFESGKFIYRKKYTTQGKAVEVEVDFNDINNWQPY